MESNLRSSLKNRALRVSRRVEWDIDVTDFQRALRAVHPTRRRSDTHRKWIGWATPQLTAKYFFPSLKHLMNETCHPESV